MSDAGAITIEFSRTGGIAAVPGLQVRGTVTFANGRAAVQSGDYHRDLDGAERDHLAAAAGAVAQQGDSIAPRDGARDAYQYQVTVRAADRTVTIAASDQASAPLPPPVQTLLDFLDRECAAIVRARR